MLRACTAATPNMNRSFTYPQAWPGGSTPYPVAARFSLTIALSSALKKFERSRGEKAFGPLVVSPVERKPLIAVWLP